ncbi:MAG: glycosyltransferase family 4 protein [Nitrospinae bacterium]|nr:glycosyltransferase family 4 protein [Nitrospinota bacterium]
MNVLEKIAWKTRRAAGLARSAVENIVERPYSSFIVSSDSAGWVLDVEANGFMDICRSLGIKARVGDPAGRKHSCVHYLSQFALDTHGKSLSGEGCRYSLAYFHGGPADLGFGELFATFAALKDRFTKVHVSNSHIATACLEAGFTPEQVVTIPIGLNVDWFPPQTAEARRNMRERLNIPQSAFVVGSFQKDGVGWGDGMEPKLIKGPDVFVNVMARAQDKIPELFVLLSGPARGYVKSGLEKLGIPYVHTFPRDPREAAGLYQAIDLYVVASRVEGGPKAILESMATGVPLVTTNVGQAVDIVEHGKNAWLAGSEDVENLADGVLTAHQNPAFFRSMKDTARKTAETEDYLAQAPRWRESFFKGYVEGI